MKTFKLLGTVFILLFCLIGSVLAQTGSQSRNDKDKPAQAKNNASPPEKRTNTGTPPKSSNAGSTDQLRQGNNLNEETSPINPNPKPSAENDAAGLNRRLDEFEAKHYISEDDLGLFYWVANPLVLGVIALLIFLALILHVLHLLRTRGLSHDIEQLAIGQRNLAGRTGTPSAKDPAIGRLSEQLNQQGQGLTQVLNRINEVDGRFNAYHGQFRDAVRAVTLTANWIGEAQLRDAFAEDGGSMSESERTSTIAMLEKYAEPLRVNASRVEPVSQSLADVVERVEGRAQVANELVGRIQNLYEAIGRFDQSHKDVSDQLASLKRGSFSQRSSQLRADQERLLEQVNNGGLSVADMVQQSRTLIERYFPEMPNRRAVEAVPLADRESELKKIVAEAPDYLMDWYNNLFQLQGQLNQVQRTSTDAELAAGLVKVQQVAREALGKFDIQPEAIQVGQTSYDRRLHDAALVRQAAQYPINTIVEVHKCGFRRMSTGEVLRRPQVVVAGAAAS
jgi:GrpE